MDEFAAMVPLAYDEVKILFDCDSNEIACDVAHDPLPFELGAAEGPLNESNVDGGDTMNGFSGCSVPNADTMEGT